MPRNSSGIYTLPDPDGVHAGETILDTNENAFRNDIAAEMTDSLSRSGEGGMLAPFKIFDGLVATPGLAFINEINSGLYRAGAQDVRMSIAGGDAMTWTSSRITNHKNMRAVNGTQALPAYAFSGEPSTGFYLPAAGDLGVSVSGVNILTFHSNRIDYFQPMFLTDTVSGAKTNPLTLINAADANNTAVALRLRPSTTGTQFGEISATNNGAGSIEMALRTSVGGVLQKNLYLTDTGRVIVGHDVKTSPINSELEVESIGGANLALGMWANAASGARIDLYKSRGATVGNNQVLQNGDHVGDIDGFASTTSASTFINVSQQTLFLEGAPVGGNKFPMAYRIRLTDAAGAMNECLYLSGSGSMVAAFPTDASLVVGTGTNGVLDSKLRVFAANSFVMELNGVTEADAANKTINVTMTRFNIGDAPFGILRATCTAADNGINIGGGSGSTAPATVVRIHTGPINPAGNAGIIRMVFTDDGQINTTCRFSHKQGASLAAATVLNLGMDGNHFRITGNTQIRGIPQTGWQGGSVVYLTFTNSPIVTHNDLTISPPDRPIWLAGAANFAASPQDQLTLVYDDIDLRWYEVARTVI